MLLLDGLAHHLHARGLVSYRPETTGGDCFLEHLPPTPDQVVGLWLYGGREPDALNPWDEPSLQARVRGTRDARISRARAEAIYAEMHGLGPLLLPDGTWLQLAVAVQSGPVPLGPDQNGRHEHVVNVRLDVERPTMHRP